MFSPPPVQSHVPLQIQIQVQVFPSPPPSPPEEAQEQSDQTSHPAGRNPVVTSPHPDLQGGLVAGTEHLRSRSSEDD